MVKVYGTKTCHYCRMAKDFLTENNIEFEYIDVGESAEAREELEKLGLRGVPVFKIGDKVIHGFVKENLKKELNIN